MMHENIVTRMQWASFYYRRDFSTQNMSVDGGHDVKIVLEDGEQLLLEYLSPARISVACLFQGKGSRVRQVGSDCHDEGFKEPSKRRRLRTFYCKI